MADLVECQKNLHFDFNLFVKTKDVSLKLTVNTMSWFSSETSHSYYSDNRGYVNNLKFLSLDDLDFVSSSCSELKTKKEEKSK